VFSFIEINQLGITVFFFPIIKTNYPKSFTIEIVITIINHYMYTDDLKDDVLDEVNRDVIELD
jgi:hypothetical protein